MDIYVKHGFKQIVGDKVLGTYSTGVEVSTETPEHYDTYRLRDNDMEFYNDKLTACINARVSAYAEINQDDLRFDDEVNGTTLWVDTIKAIKEKYPKPTKPEEL